MKTKIKTFFVFCMTAVLLSGCIGVEDLGAYWDRGTVDPALAGRWKMTPQVKDADPTQKFFVFEKSGDHYRLIAEDNTADPDEVILAKTLEAGGHSFLLLYEPVDGEDPAVARSPRHGNLWPYKITEGGIQFTRIAEAQVGEMEKISDGLIMAEAVGGAWEFTINKLDDASVASLVKAANVPALWEVWATGEKVEPKTP